MKKSTAFIGILGLIIFSTASIIKQFSPTSISDFFYGLYTGIALVCIVVMIILFGKDLFNFLKKSFKSKNKKTKPEEFKSDQEEIKQDSTESRSYNDY